MAGTDRYGGMNLWTLARSLRSNDCPCPRCNGRSALETEVVRGTEERLRLEVVCEKCGRTSLDAEVLPSGDIRLTLTDTDDVYEPSFDVAAAQEDVRTSDGASRLLAQSRLAAALADSMRESQSMAEGIKVIRAAKKLADRSPEMCDLALRQASDTASVWMNKGNPDAAMDVYDEVKDLAENCETSAAYMIILNRSFAQYSSGEAKEPLKTVRDTVDRLDRLKAEGKLPAGDPFIRARAYEALGVLLSSKNDKKGAMNAMKKAVAETEAVLDGEVSDESIRWYNRCSREYAFACSEADMKKRSMEALKNAVKTAKKYSDRYPNAYAESLLERAMFVIDSDMAVPPYLRGDMDEAISILGRPDEEGRYEPLLPIAYFYRSTTGSNSKDELDGEDLAKAYSILRDGVMTGKVPDGVFSTVSNSYLVYLEGTDRTRADEVREELRDMGLFVSMGQSTVKSS